MSRSSFTFAALSFVAAWLAGAGVARAQTCQQNQDCPSGFTCVETVSGKTTTLPCRGTTGQACDQPAANGGTGGTATTSIKECQPASCNTDADCGSDTVCHQQTSTTCTGGAAVAPCEPNTKCTAGGTTQDTCTTTTHGVCAFRWQLPCQADSDCGDGFTCHPTVMTSCAGSVGSSGPGTTTGSGTSGSTGAGAVGGKSDVGGAGGGSTGAGNASGTSGTGGVGPDTTTCTSAEVYPGWCAPKVTTCVTDTDCPALWTCASYSYPVRGASSSSGGGGTGGSSGMVRT